MLKSIRTVALFISSTTLVNSFSPFSTVAFRSKRLSQLNANIRSPSEKAKELRFGWDGTTALGGAVEVAKPSRMLDVILSSGESIPSECEVFNANLEMDGSDVMFEDVVKLIDTYYETGLITFKNGDITNEAGENEGSAKILSYAGLSRLNKENTLKLWGQYYRDVVAKPSGEDHKNIRNFMKYGWEGVSFSNGIALTKKKTGNDSEWDAFTESWIP